MSNKELEEQLKGMMETFLAGIKLDEQYLLQSQTDLNSILNQCIIKTENINESVPVTQEKCDIINQKLNRIPKLQARIEGLSKLFYEAHKRIQVINKNMGHLEKIEQIELQYSNQSGGKDKEVLPVSINSYSQSSPKKAENSSEIPKFEPTNNQNDPEV